MIYKIQLCSGVLQLTIVMHLLGKLNVFATQIETCHSNMFLDITNGQYTHHPFYETTEFNIAGHDNGINEEVQLFDWEELLRDITPVLHNCQIDGVETYCSNGYADIFYGVE